MGCGGKKNSCFFVPPNPVSPVEERPVSLISKSTAAATLPHRPLPVSFPSSAEHAITSKRPTQINYTLHSYVLLRVISNTNF